MSKQLYLVRHAQAESQGAGVKDFERELLSNGFSDASRMGKKLKDQGIVVEKVISSSAKRASMTAELICQQLGFGLNDIALEEDVYEASVRSLLSIINNIEDNVSSLMVVGHNPTISYFAEYILSEQIGSLPTTAVVAIDLNVESWKEVTAASGKKLFLEFPV